MRNIGRIDDAAQATVFSDYLYAQAIDNHVDADDDSHVIWVHDDAHLGPARELLAAFRAEPEAERFHAARSSARARRKEVQAKDQAYRDRIRLAQLTLYGADGRGDLTRAFLVISVLVGIGTGLGSNWQLVSPLMLTNASVGALLPEVLGGQIWRLVTPVFVHFGITHLLFNMWMWWGFAQRVEHRKGLRWFGLFALAAAVFSNLAEFGLAYLMAGGALGVGVSFGGMSGVLYALFGFVWFKGRLDPLDELAVDPTTQWMLLGWLVLCMTGAMGPIANGAHFGGLVFGVLWAYGDVAVFNWRKRRR